MNRQSETKLLFICPNNSIFSPIAAAWAQKLGGDEIQCFSAGINSCTKNETAIAVMNEAEITPNNSPMILSEALLKWPDLVIAYIDETTKPVKTPPGLQLFKQTIPSQPDEIDRHSIRLIRDNLFKQIQPLIISIKKGQQGKQLRLDKKQNSKK